MAGRSDDRSSRPEPDQPALGSRLGLGGPTVLYELVLVVAGIAAPVALAAILTRAQDLSTLEAAWKVAAAGLLLFASLSVFVLFAAPESGWRIWFHVVGRLTPGQPWFDDRWFPDTWNAGSIQRAVAPVTYLCASTAAWARFTRDRIGAATALWAAAGTAALGVSTLLAGEPLQTLAHSGYILAAVLLLSSVTGVSWAENPERALPPPSVVLAVGTAGLAAFGNSLSIDPGWVPYGDGVASEMIAWDIWIIRGLRWGGALVVAYAVVALILSARPCAYVGEPRAAIGAANLPARCLLILSELGWAAVVVVDLRWALREAARSDSLPKVAGYRSKGFSVDAGQLLVRDGPNGDLLFALGSLGSGVAAACLAVALFRLALWPDQLHREAAPPGPPRRWLPRTLRGPASSHLP